MIITPRREVWISRLHADDLEDDLGSEGSAPNEIPHVHGLPVHVAIPPGSIVVREWPNVAGRLERVDDGDVVRWCRSLAPEPSLGTVIPRGEGVRERVRTEMRQWLLKFARSLTQIPGVSVATPTDTPRVILLTPRGLSPRSNLPRGIEPTPRRLAEFPGGVMLTLEPRTYERRAEYAAAVESIIGEG